MLPRSKGADRSGQGSLSLPDFCAASAVLVVVLISELVAVVLTLARAGIGYAVPFWVDLARNSLFMLWIGLSSAAVLCYGPHTLGAGRGFTLRYRVLVHPGRLDADRLQKAHAEFTEAKGNPKR